MVLQIKKSNQVTSGRFLIIGVSFNTFMARGYRTIEFSFFSTPMSCHRVKVMNTLFLMVLLVFLERLI